MRIFEFLLSFPKDSGEYTDLFESLMQNKEIQVASGRVKRQAKLGQGPSEQQKV